MTELRNVQADLARFRTRVFVVSMLVLVCFFLLFARLVYLQIFRHDDLRAQAESNRTSIVPIVPNRGLIVDRNGIVLATNYSAYTLEITPSKSGGVEETLDELSKVVDITPRDRRRFKKLMEESKSFESLPIRTRLTDTEVARFAAQRFRFPGVEIKARLFRNYPLGETGSHLLGYIGRISAREKAAAHRTSAARTGGVVGGTAAFPGPRASSGLQRASRTELAKQGADAARRGDPTGSGFSRADAEAGDSTPAPPLRTASSSFRTSAAVPRLSVWCLPTRLRTCVREHRPLRMSEAATTRAA